MLLFLSLKPSRQSMPCRLQVASVPATAPHVLLPSCALCCLHSSGVKGGGPPGARLQGVTVRARRLLLLRTYTLLIRKLTATGHRKTFWKQKNKGLKSARVVLIILCVS